jgi:AcrR family transcriptional regulator
VRREDRAERILDVAADLLVRHGYRRVTIDDVARGADIGKGTVYLHWRTREELFSAVVEREVRAAVGGLLRALERDHRVALPHRLAPAYFLSIMDRPLLRGFLLADADLLGKLARSDTAREDQHQLMSARYFELLAEQGLLPADLTPEAAAYAFLATFEGFLRADRGDAGAADLLAGTIQRAFETGRDLDAAALDRLADRVAELLRDLTDH